jgi:hypothetical protein
LLRLTIERIGVYGQVGSVHRFKYDQVVGWEGITRGWSECFLYASEGDGPGGWFEEHFVHFFIDGFFIEFKLALGGAGQVLFGWSWSPYRYEFIRKTLLPSVTRFDFSGSLATIRNLRAMSSGSAVFSRE